MSLSFPKTIEVSKEDFEKSPHLIKENGLSYPILIKTKWAAVSLTDHSHDLILLKNERAL